MSDPFARVEIEGDAGRGIVRREHAVALAAGHFPDDPFLPAAYLVELTATLAERVAAPARARGAPVVHATLLLEGAAQAAGLCSGLLAPGARS